MKQIFTYLPILAITLMFSLPACEKSGKPESPSKIIVATVNGKEIMGDTFLMELQSVKRKLRITEPKDETLNHEFRDDVLEKMIAMILLLEEADNAGLKTDLNMRDDIIDSLLKGFSPARLQIILENNDRSFESWKDGVNNNLLIEKLVHNKVAPLVKVPESEIHKYYKEHPEEFNIKERVRAYHIVVSTLADADNVRNDIMFGSDFSSMAKKHSISLDAANGGDLGIFPKGQMPPEFDNEIFGLKINRISKVVESPYGFHLFKVTKKYKPTAMKYPKAKKVIYKKIFNDHLEQEFKKWMKKKKENAEIVIFSKQLYLL